MAGVATLASTLVAPAALAQQQPPPQSPRQVPQSPPRIAPSPVPVPSALEINKLIWSTMAAIDHANLAGNYSVLRDLSAPNFQVLNDSARLTAIFSSLRATGIDLSNALLLTPTLTAAPRLPQRDVMELRGYFGLRPTAINFEIYYQWVAGRWRLYGVGITPASLSSALPGAAPPPSQKPSAPPAQPARPPRRN